MFAERITGQGRARVMVGRIKAETQWAMGRFNDFSINDPRAKLFFETTGRW